MKEDRRNSSQAIMTHKQFPALEFTRVNVKGLLAASTGASVKQPLQRTNVRSWRLGGLTAFINTTRPIDNCCVSLIHLSIS